MKLLIVADIHIKLGQRKVPRDWQANRIMLLADEINKHDVDKVVIAGDLLDVAKPTVDELGLMLDFLHAINPPKLIIPGNHEMVTKKKDCYLSLTAQLDELYDTEVVREFDSTTIPGVDLIPYNVINNPFTPVNKLAITHVRGEIPPHVVPEIDLDVFNDYEKVFAGDLHSHTNTQRNIYYPGSPFTTSFHRKPSNKGTTGIFLVDTETLQHEWVQLDLPELLRYTVNKEEDMVKHDYHHVVYELEGDLESLASVQDSELLDKKRTTDIYTEAQLKLDADADIVEEVKIYLTDIRGIEQDRAVRAATLAGVLSIGE